MQNNRMYGIAPHNLLLDVNHPKEDQSVTRTFAIIHAYVKLDVGKEVGV